MKDNISPEEKLLRLIRGQNKKDTLTDNKPIAVNSTSLSDLKPSLKSSVTYSIKKYSSFFNVSKIIAIIFIAFLIYLTTSYLYPLLNSEKIKLSEPTHEVPPEAKTEPKQEIKPLEFYLQGIRNHRIFASVVANAQGEAASSAGAVNADLIKDISLVGIISGENPQAVIEDRRTQKTCYVTKGQFIGELKVEDIQEGKIILNYQGRKLELYL